MINLTPASRSSLTADPIPRPDFSGTWFDQTRSTGVGFPIERDLISAVGADAATYLHGQLSQDVEGLAVGSSAWSLLLQPAGKLNTFLVVTRTADDSFVLAMDLGAGAEAMTRLQRFRLRVECELTLSVATGVALRGAVPIPEPADGLLVAHYEWAGIRCVDVSGPDAAIPEGVTQLTNDQAELLRVATGLPRMGAELDEKTIPAEAGIVMMSTSFTKGCYVGQELVARVNSRGNNTPRHLARLASDDVIVAGAELGVDNETVGVITSVAANPDGGWLALGYIARKAGDADEFAVAGSDTPVRLLAYV